MDSELRLLVEAVRDGRITDAIRCREILAAGRAIIEQMDESLHARKVVLFEAEQAFVHGWPTAVNSA